jgi:PAS domain S-box-containing protein
MKATAHPRTVFILTLVLAAGIFAFDVLTPLGFADWIFYLIPLFAVANWLHPRQIYLLVAVSSVLIVLGYYFSPPATDMTFMVINRALQIAALWIVAFLLAQRRRMEDRLLVDQAELEGQVRARTADLEQELAERTRIQSSVDQLAAIVESSQDAIVGTDFDGRITSWNHGAERIYGHAAADVLGTDVFQLFLPGPAVSVQPVLEQIRQGKTISFAGRAWQTPAGERFVLDITLGPVMRNAGEVFGIASVARDVTPRKQVEEALKASESRLKAIIENSDAAIWSVDREYRLLAANAVCERGTIAQIGRPLEWGESVLHESMPARYIDFWRANYDRVLAGERLVLEAESWIQHRGGMVEIHLSPILEDGAITGVVGLSRDITERKRTEAALRASEERLRFALEATNEGLWDWNIQTGEVFANDHWFAQYGYAPGEIQPSIQLWIDAIHPDDASLAMQMVDDYAGGSSGKRGSEHRIVTRSGEIRWHQGIGKIVEWDADGRPLRIVGTNTDITERKLAEQKLRASEQRYRMLADHVQDVIWAMDHKGKYIYVSPSIERESGYTAEEFVQLTETDFLTPASACVMNEIRKQIVADTVATGRPVKVERVELEQIRRDGTTAWVEVIGNTICDASGKLAGAVGVTRDITERKQMEQALREMNLELEQRVAERTIDLRSAIAELERANAGKDAFMATVSHELRTPLTGILSMSEILQSQMRGPLNSKQAQYVTAIHESGQRLLATVNGVLHYTSLIGGVTPIQRENCRLVELCASAVRHVKADAEARQQQIRRTFSPLDVRIESDAQGIIQVLKELLENAVKFTPNGGHIDVTVMAMPEEDAVRLVVADDGIGMSSAQVATLFRPFSQGEQTLARRFGGLGLGLAYVHEMVARLGGSVTVASEPGCGSRFTVTLPASMPH